MKKYSHLKLITMSLLQTCGYVSEQMHTNVTIDVNKFLEAFSIDVPGGQLCPPSWTLHERDSVMITQPSPIPPTLQTGETPTSFTMEDYRRCRQAEALHWIDLQEKRSSIIARLQPTTSEEYAQLRNAVKAETAPFCRKGKKQTSKNKPIYVLNNYLIPSPM